MKKKAVSLKYFGENLNAPLITAIGDGFTADKIISIAKKNNVDVVKNNDFFKYNKELNINSEIPEELFSIVSEILAFIISTNDKIKQRANK